MSPVKLYEQVDVLNTKTLEPLNPHPIFPQWCTYDVYPYQFMGNMQYRPCRRAYRMVYLENEYLRVCVAPDIGGRVWDIYDKLAGRHAVNYSSGVLMYNAGFGLNYSCGGLEINYPLAHSCPTSRRREYRTESHPDGSKSVLIGEYEQIWRTRWSFRFTLRPGRSFLEQTVRIYNRSLHDSRYMYWANCGIPLNDDTRFIYPENAGALHGKETDALSWPVWRKKDLSCWKNTLEAFGLYMLNVEEPYFGYYDYGARYGLAHYGDISDLPGKKYWSWGAGFAGRDVKAKTHNSEGIPYGEMQSGRITIQEHLDRLPPETESEWTEYWFPVRNTDGFCGVGRDAALNLKLAAAGRRSEITVKAIGTGSFPAARLALMCPGKAPVEARLPLTPRRVSEITIKLPYPVKADGTLTARLVNRAGEILAAARLKDISKRDSWAEVRAPSQDAKALSAEEMVVAGEALARDWFNHDESSCYEDALKMDPGLSSAHLELGKIRTVRADYPAAIEHLRQAVARNSGLLDGFYSLGVAHLLAGQAESAARCLEKSARYDFESRSRTRLAEIKMRDRDFHHALRYLDRVTQAAPRLTRPMTLKAICLRRLGRLRAAAETAARAGAVDPCDPFPQMEQMLIARAAGRKDLRRAIKALLVQLRNYEPPYLEAVMDYGNVGLWQDALLLLGAFPRPGPLAMLYRAYAEHQLGRACAARTLQRAMEMDPVNHCAWQLELIPVLEWARAVLPRNPRVCLHLGNLFVARRRLPEGVRMWQQAAALGEKSYLLYSSLGYYEARIAKNPAAALRSFERAHRMEPGDLYVILELFGLIRSQKSPAAAVRFLEDRMASVLKSPRIAQALMGVYLEDKSYGKFDALVPRLQFADNWNIPGPHSQWMTRYINQALDLMGAGKYEQALACFDKSLRAPANLGFNMIESDKQERIFYHQGRCFEKLGRLDRARALWEKAVAVERHYGWEPSRAFVIWGQRYFQALCLKKLGRNSEAAMILDGLELLAMNKDLSAKARKYMLDLYARARFGTEAEQDPYMKKAVEVQYSVEL